MIIVGLLLITACQQVSDVGMEEELTGDLTIALGARYMSAGTLGGSLDSDDHPVFARWRAIQSQHPELTIDLINYVFMTGTSSPIQQDPFPDLIELVPNQIRWIVEDELEELDDVLPVNRWSQSYAELIEKTKVNGAIWMLPIRAEPLVVYYDERVFLELGISEPHDVWQWEDFVTASQILDRNSYATDLPDSFDAVEPIIRGLGGSYTSTDGRQFTDYLDSEETIAAFDRYMSTMRVQLAANQARNLPVALGITWPHSLYTILKENPDIRITRMPIFPDGQRHNTMFVTGVALSSQSEHKASVIELMKAFTTDDDRTSVRSANYYALVSRQSNYDTDPPEQLQQLIHVMEQETAIATPNTFQLNANVINYYGVLNLHAQDFQLAFPKMLEMGTAGPVVSQLAGIVDTLFATQRGNWAVR